MSRLYIDKMYIDYNSLLGPSPRLLLWLHGCDKNCPGCIAIDWNKSSSTQYSLSVETVIQFINRNDELEGVTISGGEPFLQSESLSQLVSNINKGIIVYSGYTIDELQKLNKESVSKVLSKIDVLIDGRYVEELNDDKPFRGSSNQTIHLFNDRYADFYSKLVCRNTVTEKKDGFLFLYGIPDKNTRDKWLEFKKIMNKGGTV